MCNKTQKLLSQISTKVMPASYKAILKEFASYGDWQTGTGIKPSLQTIVKNTSYSLATVKRAKAYFIKLGILKRVAKHNMKTLTAEELRIDFDVVNNVIKQPVNYLWINRKSSVTVTWESSVTVSPNNNTYIISTNTVGKTETVDNSQMEAIKASIRFLKECEVNGINIGNKLERYRGLVPQEVFLEALAA